MTDSFRGLWPEGPQQVSPGQSVAAIAAQRRPGSDVPGVACPERAEQGRRHPSPLIMALNGARCLALAGRLRPFHRYPGRRFAATAASLCPGLACYGPLGAKGILSAIVLLLSLNLSAVANAQEEDEPPVQVQDVQFEIQENQFDSWIFLNLQTVQAARIHLEKLLRLQTEDVGRACELGTNQRKKLQLAGRGDIQRFLDEVEMVRQKFQLVRKDQNKFNEIWQDIQPLQMKFQGGLHDDNSLFRKTLRNMLDTEQLEHFSQHDGERRLFHYRARVELVVSMLENALPMRDEQRQKLIALVVEQTKPPKKFSQQDYYVVMLNLSKVPEAKLRPLFDETDWRVLRQQFAQVQGMQQWLKQNGVLDEEEGSDTVEARIR